MSLVDWLLGRQSEPASGQVAKERLKLVLEYDRARLTAAELDQIRDEIRDRFVTLVEDMTARGAHVHMPRGDLDYAVEVGLRLLELRRILRCKDGRYRINPPDRPLLRYYANSIGHLSDAIPELEAHIAPDLASDAT